jgi:SAM-dependent methyltransferase
MTDRSPAAATRDPTRRFSDRVENYARYRPGYPEAVVATLEREAGLTPSSVVADVGSGTGISALLFLRLGCRVYGVEPNREMRGEAERRLAGYPGFTSVDGTAEATTLGDAAVDFVVAAQAFHWFDRPRARAELVRVLRPGGWVVVLWNRRLTDDTPFAVAYEALLLEHGTDYRQVDHRQVTPEQLAGFFAGPFESRTFANEQVFDLAGLRGRLLSSSYVPAPGDPRHQPMLDALERLFAAHQQQGRVRFDYATEMYFGRLGPAPAASGGG